jgi:hypothetical protein
MRISTTLACLLAPCAAHNVTSRIVGAAAVDGINLYSLPFAAQALASIQDIYGAVNVTEQSRCPHARRTLVVSHRCALGWWVSDS